MQCDDQSKRCATPCTCYYVFFKDTTSVLFAPAKPDTLSLFLPPPPPLSLPTPQAQLTLLAQEQLVIIVVPGCASDADEEAVLVFFEGEGFAQLPSEQPQGQLHLVCTFARQGDAHARVLPHAHAHTRARRSLAVLRNSRLMPTGPTGLKCSVPVEVCIPERHGFYIYFHRLCFAAFLSLSLLPLTTPPSSSLHLLLGCNVPVAPPQKGCEHAASVTHIVRRLATDCHADVDTNIILQVQKFVKVLVLADAPSAGMKQNVLSVQEFAPADHIAAALSM